MQRKLRIGYNRSARLLEDMEKAGWSAPSRPAASAKCWCLRAKADLPQPSPGSPGPRGSGASRGRASRSRSFAEKDFHCNFDSCQRKPGKR